MATVFQQLSHDGASAAQRAGRGLVHISNGKRGAGAGTIWHPDGLIITNAHVASGEPLHITLPSGATLPARLLARDTNRDLAAVAVEASGLPTIALGHSTALQPGQWVMALGHPWGVRGARRRWSRNRRGI